MINRERKLLNDTNTDWTANATGTAQDVSDMGEKTVYVWAKAGTYGATSVQLQASGLAGTSAPGAADPSWINLGAAITATGFVHLTSRQCWLRAVVSSINGGATIAISVVGDIAHEAGGRRSSQ